ncbi:putative nutrient binding outer membrane protein [Cyclobacterium qasimii M12-11B]|uniref:Putative nutrient binding outer membrane protein n=1 Tax=Cyclobacterium qasimii M12-11B TaxID=641524 RepID=S7WHS2_9BACT|nr:putative nutrient binding outer membrane protein [Cyclobacterium qasimii M12-11B]
MFQSCTEDFLNIDPKGQLFPETFYSTNDELEMAVTGIYQIMNKLQFYGYSLSYTAAGRDKTSTFVNFVEVDIFDTESDNGEMLNYWAKSYEVINAANMIIENYQDADATQEQKELAAGQAHFIRGYAFFHLVRMYNEVPVWYSQSELSPEIELTGPADIYSLVIEDLKIAEEFLPDNWSGDARREGVAWTNGAAKSLLSYVYLSMTGYPLNDQSKYALAAEKAKEVIDNADRWGYRLVDDIAELYSKEFNYENRSSDEVVLAFYNDNEWGCPLCGVPGEYGGWEVYMADINFFETYPDGPRKDAIFMWEFPMADGSVKHYSELSSKHPWYKQYWDGKIDWDKPWDGMNWKNSRPQVSLTHANNLLVYAEAQAMSSSPDASAYEAVNKVRNRAGLEDLPEGLSTEEFRDAVVQEREWEFAGGYFTTAPWYDLVRLERVEASVLERHPDENPLVNQPSKARYFAPYPVTERMNPNLSN